ncbi:complement component C1q receptor-like [Ptychodera flava]|uniref:complement component C1q receptor-like n=1 Tax=Ptychodera flava TaxID=63121 RepID=UPI00396A6041
MAHVRRPFILIIFFISKVCIYSDGLSPTPCDTYGCEQRCTEGPDGPVCSCENGYSLDTDNFTCSDIDECAAGTSGCSQICTNTNGGSECSCFDGYNRHPSLAFLCQDINECLDNKGNCDHFCDNTQGSYECSCDANYTLWSDGHSCDIDECDDADRGNCQSLCVNTLGSYHCDCVDGYELAADLTSCRQVPTQPNTLGPNTTSQFGTSGSREGSFGVTETIIVVSVAGVLLIIATVFTIFVCCKKAAIASTS